MKLFFLLVSIPALAFAQPILQDSEMKGRKFSDETVILEAHIKSVNKPFSGARTISEFEITTVHGTRAIVDLGHLAKSHEQITAKQGTAYAVSANPRLKQQPRPVFEPGKPIFLQLTFAKNRIADARILDAASVSRARAQTASGGKPLPMEKEQILARLESLRAKLKAGGSSATVTGVTGYIGTVQMQMSDEEKAALKAEIDLLEAQLLQ